MRYTVHLFALNADAFADELKDDPDGVTARVSDWLRDSDFDQQDQKFGLNLVRRICEGRPPDEYGEDAFWALCWIGDALLERVDFPALNEFRWLKFFEATRIWPLLTRTPPPFPTPISAEFPPGVGFLRYGAVPRAIQSLSALSSHTETDDVLRSPTLARLSNEELEWARYAREQFAEILESLGEDELDLLMIVVHA